MLLTKRGLQIAVLYGLVSGLFLAALLKIVEYITHFKVYTLLLNVDYIPYINTFIFPELVEVGFHLIVSIALAICLYLLIVYEKFHLVRKSFFYVHSSVSSLAPHYSLRPHFLTKHLHFLVFPHFHTGLGGT